MNLRFGFVLALSICAPGSIAAQQQVPEAGVQKSPGTDVEILERQYEQISAEWKKLVIELQKLQTEYVLKRDLAKPEEIKSIIYKFDELIKQGQELEPKVRAAAQKYYIASPNKDPDVAIFMFWTIEQYFAADDYEETFRLGKILIDNQHKNQVIYSLVGTAAFHLNDYEMAQKYFKKGEEENVLRPDAVNIQKKFESFREDWREEQAIRQSETNAGREDPEKLLPRVKIQTTQGDLVVELFENEAPNTVTNFIDLVEDRFYDNLAFHSVINGFMAQGGCPKGDGSGGPGYRIACECYQKNYRKHFRGSLSMALNTKDTGGSQFFITFVRRAELDGKHTVFGRVVEGMEVLSKLRRTKNKLTEKPLENIEYDRIIKATVLRKRSHVYILKIFKSN